MLTMMLLTPSWSLAAEELVTLATRQSIPPYVNAGAVGGIEIDIVSAIFAEANIPVKFEQMPHVRMLPSFVRGRVDGVLTQSATNKTAGCATDWYMAHTNVGISLASNNFRISKLSDLHNRTVVAFVGAKGGLHPDYGEAVGKSPQYFEGDFQTTHVELIYKRRFDVAIGDEWILRLAQREHFDRTGMYAELRIHTILKPSLFSARFYEQETCDRFNAALKRLRVSGAYDAIMTKHHERIAIPGGMR